MTGEVDYLGPALATMAIPVAILVSMFIVTVATTWAEMRRR